MSIALVCTACRTQLRVAENTAGKSVKCPKCGTILPARKPVQAITAAVPPRQAPAGAPRQARAAPTPPPPPVMDPPLPQSATVPPTPLDLALEEYLEEHLEPGERVLWTGQPWRWMVTLDILKWSLLGAAIAVPFLLVVSVLFPSAGDATGKAVLAFAGLLAVGTGAGLAGYFVVRCRKQGRYTGYVLTNQRALVVYRDPGGKKSLRSFTAKDARFMYVKKSWLAPGGGHLIFRASQQTNKVVEIGLEKAVRQSTVEIGFMNLAQVEQVEQLAQDILVTAHAAPSRVPGPGAKLVPHAPNPELPWTLPAAWQRTVDKELGTNELVLWAGKPDRAMSFLHSLSFSAGCLALTLLTWSGLVDLILKQFGEGHVLGKDRWFLGCFPLALGFAALFVWVPFLMWKAHRTLYVLTNRRALVWRPGLLGFLTWDEYRPHELTNTHFRQSWVFAAGAGDVVFRIVRHLKTVRTSYTTKSTQFGRRIRFGFLRIRQADKVAQLVQAALVKPYLGKD